MRGVASLGPRIEAELGRGRFRVPHGAAEGVPPTKTHGIGGGLTLSRFFENERSFSNLLLCNIGG
jgi:hypothetical protein